MSQSGGAVDASATTPVMTKRQIRLVIYGLMAGMFLSSLDQTIVGTSIRTIGDDLHGLDQQAWVTTAYLICATVTTPLYGKLSDLFGRRPLYLISIGIFVAGSIMASFSTSMLMLAAFRGVQGLGAGGLMSLPLAIIGDMLAPRERARYQGFFMAVFGISAVLGPVVGGLFAGADQILGITGWRWVFLVNAPVGILAFAMVFAFLHVPYHADAVRPRIDWLGAGLVVASLAPLLLVAEQGREWGWTSAASIACYAIGVVGLVGFILVERRMGSDAILPLRLFNKPFSMTAILSVLIGFGMFGAMMTLPLYLQIVVGLTPTESGLATLPLMAGIMVTSIGSGQIILRTGKYGIFPSLGAFTLAAGYFILTFITVDRPLWFLMIAMFVIGLGLGQLMQTLTLAAQNAVEAKDMGVATSSATFFRQIGGTLGTAVLLSVLFGALPANISTAMTDKTSMSAALDAALDPAVASAPQNQQIMDEMWGPITKPIKAQIDQQLTVATQQIRDQVPAAQFDAALKQVAASRNLSVSNGKLVVDYSNADQRQAVVDEAVPEVTKAIESAGDDSATSDASSDTSFLEGADPRLTRPFLTAFNQSVVTVYWVALGVVLVACVFSLFYRVPPLRARSAIEEREADLAAALAERSDGDAQSAQDKEPALPRANG